MKKLLDLRYGQEEQLAKSLSRMCYPIALSMEVRQPASALKLLQASHRTHDYLLDTMHPFGRGKAERKVAKALRALKCTRAVLRMVVDDAEHRNETHKEAARITAALEIADRLVDMLNVKRPNDNK